MTTVGRGGSVPIDPWWKDGSASATAGTRLRHCWQSLGRPSSLSLRVPLIYGPIGAIGPLLLDRPVAGGTFIAWLWVAICGELVILACFPLAKIIVHGRPGLAAERTRPLATLIAMLMAAILRGLMVAFLAQQIIGSSLLSEISYRLVAAALFHSGFLVLIALLANDRDDHRAVVWALRERERQLIELDATALERLAAMHRQLVEEVRSTVRPQVEELLTSLSTRPIGIDSDASIQQINRFVEEELRPLSHRLASTPIMDVPVVVAARPSLTARTPLPRRLSIVDCLLTWPSVWLIFVAAIVGAMRNAAPGQQVTFIVGMTGTTMLGLLIARRAAVRWAPPTPITVCVVVLLNLALPTGALWMLYREGITGSNAVMTAAAVGATIGFFSAGYGAVGRGRYDAQRELRMAVARLEASVNVVRQKAWVTRRQLGYVMHGALQGSLYSAALRLASADCVDARVVEAIERDVSNALAKLEGTSLVGADIDETLEDIADLWSGDCQVQWQVEPRARAALAAHPETSACVAEIVREAISNAIHHGGAADVRLVIDELDAVVSIEVVDDGRHWDPHAVPGLGSRMRDEMCLEWSLHRLDDCTVLNASLALESTSSAVAVS